MALRKVRNTYYAPVLDGEGTRLWPLPKPPPVKDGIWYTGLTPYQRLFYHQTLNNVRKGRGYVPNPNIPKDSLDFTLQSRFNESAESFPDRVDIVLQRETISIPTFRVLRNTKDILIKLPDALGHPLRISAPKEKISPDSVKLINSSHRTQLTNHGFSRQPADGTFFHY